MLKFCVMEKIKIKYSSILPFPGFYAMQFFGTIYIRKEYEGLPVREKLITHETIHYLQALDFGIGKWGFIPFYLIYGIEWILKLPMYFWGKDPYFELGAEREAYDNEENPEYLETRKRWTWIKRIFK